MIKHVFIFEGAPATGKSDLGRLIDTREADVIDDVIPSKIPEIINHIRYYVSPRNNYIVICNNPKHSSELISRLKMLENDDLKIKISFCTFERK